MCVFLNEQCECLGEEMDCSVPEICFSLYETEEEPAYYWFSCEVL
jgi:hypothetical protein